MRRIYLFYIDHRMDDGLCHDSIQHGTRNRNFYKSHLFYCAENMWIEYIIIGLLAYFVSSHLAKMCAFRVVQPGDRPIFIIFAIQTFTVIWQVAFASVISVFHADTALPPILYQTILPPTAKILSWHSHCS